jgi:hypothetical protein
MRDRLGGQSHWQAQCVLCVCRPQCGVCVCQMGARGWLLSWPGLQRLIEIDALHIFVRIRISICMQYTLNHITVPHNTSRYTTLHPLYSTHHCTTLTCFSVVSFINLGLSHDDRHTTHRHTTLHYTLHTTHYTPQHTTTHYTTHFIPHHYTTLHYTLHTTRYYTTLHTSHYTTIHDTMHHSTTLHAPLSVLPALLASASAVSDSEP